MTKGKMIIIGFVLLIVAIGALTLVHCFSSQCPWEKCSGKNCKDKPKKVQLTFVGSWDKKEDWEKVIANFRQYEITNKNLDVTVSYEQLDKYNYEDILLDRMINKKTPNLFLMFNTWLPKYQQRIVEAPESLITLNQFENAFPKVAQNDLTSDGKIYSLPLYIDTLALFYNKDMFANAGLIKPPETWNDFESYVEKLTIIGKDGKINRLGATIGGSKTVDRSQDILMLMVMQNNMEAQGNSGNLVSFRTLEAQRAVKYYTDFADPTKKFYTWDYTDQTYSIDAFTQMRAAMSINYSYEIANIQSKTGGALNYGVAPVPQQYLDDKVNYANYWSPVVAKDADCTKEAGAVADCTQLSWDFIGFAAQANNAQAYIDATGRPAANLALATKQAGVDGSDLAPFASQVLTARSWPDVYNSKNDKIFLDMIDSIITPDEKSKKDVYNAMMITLNQIKELN